MKLRGEQGASLLDYKFLVAIVVVLALGSVKLYGNKVQRPFCDVVPAFTGEYWEIQYGQLPNGTWVCIGITQDWLFENVFTGQACDYYDC